MNFLDKGIEWAKIWAPTALTRAVIMMFVRPAVLFALLVVAGCRTVEPAAAPADRFMAGLAGLCGKAFAGRIVSNDAADADMAGKPLVMHVRGCVEHEVRIPFHVGDDRSRTWVLTHTAAGVRLKHDHRHRDGSPDALTMYGGDSIGVGSAVRQSFPADRHSIEMFTSSGRSVSNANVWAIEVDGSRFAYELRRPPGPGERFFRVEFDLGRAIEPPPPPWGD